MPADSREADGGMLPLALKLVSPVFLIVGCLHLALGAGAEVMLGASVDNTFLSDPVIDSQNRFYGIAFTAYGFLLYLCATDLHKYQTVLRVLLWVFFAAGCARILSIMTHGLPSTFVLLLMATELLLPPACLLWLRDNIGNRENQS